MGSIPGQGNQSGIHDAPTQVATAKVARGLVACEPEFKSSNGCPPEGNVVLSQSHTHTGSFRSLRPPLMHRQPKVPGGAPAMRRFPSAQRRPYVRGRYNSKMFPFSQLTKNIQAGEVLLAARLSIRARQKLNGRVSYLAHEAEPPSMMIHLTPDPLIKS